MKAMTTKQAQKWLEKAKNANINSFKEINKILKRYERSNDEHECFTKLNNILLEHPDLTNDINNYLDQGHRFVINRSQVERINDLVKYIKKVDPKAFNEIVKMITSLSNQRGVSENSEANQDEQNLHLINFVLAQVKDNLELSAYANKALYYSAQQLIQTLDLNHLRSLKKSDTLSKADQSYDIANHPQPEREQRIEPERPTLKRYFPPFLSVNDEKVYLRQLESSLDPKKYEQLIKLIEIYQLGIISKDQCLEIIKGNFSEGDFIALKDLIESREADRRRNCSFRPLSDMDFSASERATHSYVTMPDIYPHFCSGNNQLSNQVLNKQWVSVPRGSEDTFNIRVKNTNEQNLIKAEDNRYQFDIFFARLRKSLEYLDKICIALEADPCADIEKNRQIFLGLGVVQTLYKNSSKDQKQDLQCFFGKIQLAVANLFRQRLKAIKTELEEIRSVHGLKDWNQTATKNWAKSLDIKGHEFKRIQKMKIKHTVFLEQLKKKVNYLKQGDNDSDMDNLFLGRKKNFFQVFNSFESTSRKEKCLKRNLPTPEQFIVRKDKNNTLLPALILAFEDEQALSLVYSILSFSLENSSNPQAEKIRCKFTLKYVLSQFLKFHKFEHHSLSDTFDETKFFSVVNKQTEMQEEGMNFQSWIQKQDEPGIVLAEQSEELPKFRVKHGNTCEYNYRPAKNDNNMVLYASEKFYVFLRFLYTLYERVIRMKQVLENEKKALLFEILYFSCIKCKESSRFQEALNNLFGTQSAYIFTTFYRVVQNICKSLNLVSLCPITSQSLRYVKCESEAAYIQLLNNYLLMNGQANSKIIRCTFDLPTKLLYINSLESRYNTEDPNKELPKRRADITQKIQIYTVMGSELELAEKDTSQEQLVKNRSQYCFEGNSIKLVNLAAKEDIIMTRRKQARKQMGKDDVKRAMKLLNKLQ